MTSIQNHNGHKKQGKPEKLSKTEETQETYDQMQHGIMDGILEQKKNISGNLNEVWNLVSTIVS